LNGVDKLNAGQRDSTPPLNRFQHRSTTDPTLTYPGSSQSDS
jgi:hypothetical protein